MKMKRLLAGMLGVLVCMGLAACGSGGTGSGYQDAQREVYGQDVVTIDGLDEIEVTVGSYAITDEMIRQFAQETQAVSYIAPAGTVAENGDTVVIDYKGTIDGKEFDGGSATGYRLQLGSNTMVAGFEEGILGMQEGEKKTITVTFPEDYGEHASETADFEITMYRIIRTGEPTAEELAQAEEDLKAMMAEDRQSEIENKAWEQVVAKAKIEKMDKALMDKYAAYYETSVLAGYNSLDEYLEEMQIDKKTHEQDQEEYATRNTSYTLITEYLFDHYGMKVGSDAYMAEQEKLLQDLGMSLEDAEAKFGADRLERTVTYNMVLAELAKNVKVTEADTSAETESTVEE